MASGNDGENLTASFTDDFEINDHFLEYVRTYVTTDNDFIRRVSLIEEGYQRLKCVMGWLSVVGSHKINGVAEIHSDLMVTSTFADFARIFPERFTNVTNGITPRRWLAVANPQLATLFDKYIGSEWRCDLSQIENLKRLQIKVNLSVLSQISNTITK